MPVRAQVGSVAANAPRTSQPTTVEELLRQRAYPSLSLGSLTLSPSFTLSNFGYDSNVLGTPDNAISDVTGTATFGARAIWDPSRRLALFADIYPQYVWYARTDTARAVGGIYGVGLLLSSNLLNLELRANADRAETVVNSEGAQPLTIKWPHGSALLELKVLERTSIFFETRLGRREHRPENVPAEFQAALLDLDRDERLYSGGVRYYWSRFLTTGIFVEQTQARFLTPRTPHDNASLAGSLRISLDRPSEYSFDLSVGPRRLEPRNGAAFQRVQSWTGSLTASYVVTRRISLSGFGYRGFDYSFFADVPYFVSWGGGLTASCRIGRRGTARAFGEIGTNDYPFSFPQPDGTSVTRRDRSRTFGGGLTAVISRHFGVDVAVSKTHYDSNLAVYNRDIWRIQGGLLLSTADLFGPPRR